MEAGNIGKEKEYEKRNIKGKEKRSELRQSECVQRNGEKGMKRTKE